MNYSQLHWGYANVALRELTGMPSLNYETKHKNEQELFEHINEADEKHWTMIAIVL